MTALQQADLVTDEIFTNSGKWEVYLWNKKQTQSNRDGEVGVGEEQQQHPVRIKLKRESESVKDRKQSEQRSFPTDETRL